MVLLKEDLDLDAESGYLFKEFQRYLLNNSKSIIDFKVLPSHKVGSLRFLSQQNMMQIHFEILAMFHTFVPQYLQYLVLAPRAKVCVP